ncbi:MAG: RNA methyltransferase [Ferruginibacter sp.]
MLSKSRIKDIQSLQQKKFRDEQGLFVAEGPKLVDELLKDKNFECEKLYALPGWQSGFSISNEKIEIIKDFELEKISGLVKPNMLVAVFKTKESIADFNTTGKITLLLDDIQDPGNLGTIIRTADWFGIENIICSAATADMYNPKVVQSTMASLGRVNVFYTNLEQWLKDHKGIKILAAALEGKPLSDFKNMKEAFLIIGNESKGISKTLIDMSDEKISIQKYGKAESLNAAVAAGIILNQLIIVN